MDNKTEQKIFIGVSFIPKIKEARKRIKSIWKEKYSDYKLLDMTKGINGLTDIDRFAKYVKMISQADKIIFDRGWQSSVDCILIKRICDVYNKNIDFPVDFCNNDEIILLDEDKFEYDSVNSLINALTITPNNFEVAITGVVPNYYNEWLGLSVMHHSHMVKIDNRRSLEIMMDEQLCPENVDRDYSEKYIKYHAFNKVKKFLVDINIKWDSPTIKSGIFYTDRMDPKDFDENKYDIYYASGFSSDDLNCPIKLSKDIFVDKNESFEFIGTFVTEKDSLKKATDTYGRLYIDGDYIVWKLGMEIK